MTGCDMSMIQSTAGMLANSDHTTDYNLMHEMESQPSFLERALDNANNSILSKCEDVDMIASIGAMPCLHQN